jgi:glycosyltransferase involved in cell wall biosynthesis
MSARPRVALVHDWLTGFRGGEKVLDALCELYPDAPLFTLLWVPGTTSPRIEERTIHTAFTQSLPGVRRFYRWYLPLHPWGIQSLSLRDFDLVLSSSHCVAKGVKAPPGALHICYCHTPMRYVWDRFEDYFGSGLKARLLFGPVAHLLRRWDRSTANRVHHYVANSHYVAGRIRRYYGREADEVIAPPVDTDFFTPGSNGSDGDYYLVVSALVPYKRVDVAIEAFRGRPETLVVVGKGPLEKKLRSTAGPNVRFEGRVDEERLRKLYRGCRGFVQPAVEDFGIAPVEAQACGRPVVARGEGGALDNVRDGDTGVLYDGESPRALSAAIDKLNSLSVNTTLLRDWALRFSKLAFQRRMREFIQARIEEAAGVASQAHTRNSSERAASSPPDSLVSNG